MGTQGGTEETSRSFLFESFLLKKAPYLEGSSHLVCGLQPLLKSPLRIGLVFFKCQPVYPLNKPVTSEVGLPILQESGRVQGLNLLRIFFRVHGDEIKVNIPPGSNFLLVGGLVGGVTVSTIEFGNVSPNFGRILPP